MTQTQPPTITISAASAICGVSQKTIRRWIHNGQLTAVLLGSRYRTKQEWIDSMVKPVATGSSIEMESGNDDERHEEAIENLANKFGIGPKAVPRAGLQKRSRKARRVRSLL